MVVLFLIHEIFARPKKKAIVSGEKSVLSTLILSRKTNDGIQMCFSVLIPDRDKQNFQYLKETSKGQRHLFLPVPPSERSS